MTSNVLSLDRRLAFACLVALPLMLAAQALGAWERVAQHDSLVVERRPYLGSALNEIRGTTRARASLNAVMALLRDAAYNHQWVYRSGGAEIISQDTFDQAYVYGIVDAPWPMSDRDTVVRFDYRQHPQTLAIDITITNFPDYLPEREGYVRVPDFGGFWRLEPEPDNWVRIVYQVYGDPGGWIPVWIANHAAVTSVTRTLENLPAAVARYRGARSGFVREPAGTTVGE